MHTYNILEVKSKPLNNFWIETGSPLLFCFNRLEKVDELLKGYGTHGFIQGLVQAVVLEFGMDGLQRYKLRNPQFTEDSTH